MTNAARKSITIILLLMLFTSEIIAMEHKNTCPIFGSKNINNIDVNCLKLILEELDSYSQQSFANTSKNNRRLGTIDIINENRKHGYEGWSDVPEITVFQIFWISDHLLELLGLYLNLQHGRTCKMDEYRFDRICERFRVSFLSEESVVREYVEFLSHETDVILKNSRQSKCILPNFVLLRKSQNNNERGIYLFHSYLYGDKIDAEGLKADPLFDQIKGTFGTFLRGTVSNIPLYQKMKSLEGELCSFWDNNKNINYINQGITAQELESITLSDPGISRLLMGDILFVIIMNKEQFETLDDMLKNLAKFVIKYDISSDYNFNKSLLRLFEQALPLRQYGQLLHCCLCSKERTLIGNYYSSYGVDDRREFHKKAIKIFSDLNRNDLVIFHKNCIAKICIAMKPASYYENLAQKIPLR